MPCAATPATHTAIVMIGNTIPFKRAVIRFRLFIFPSRKKKTVDRVLGLST
jgi:hypothetical protein